MPSIKEQAATDILAAAVTADALGEALTIDGVSVVAVRTELSAEEMAASGMDGANTEGMVLTLAAAALSTVPVPGQRLSVSGASWDVVRARNVAGLLRIVLQRYVS
jgi:hypothetical protein